MVKAEFGEKLLIILIGSSALIVAVIIFGFVGSFFVPRDLTAQKIEEISADIKELKREVKISDYARKDTLQRAVIALNFENTVQNNLPSKKIEKTITVKGDIADGYLYVNASVGGAKLSIYDSVYVLITSKLDGEYKDIGGHLRRDKSLDVPLGEKFTELLFRLDNVFYKESVPYKEDIAAQSADFLRVLNEGEKQKTISFTSTTGKGVISELSIYYECKEKDECSIAVDP